MLNHVMLGCDADKHAVTVQGSTPVDPANMQSAAITTPTTINATAGGSDAEASQQASAATQPVPALTDAAATMPGQSSSIHFLALHGILTMQLTAFRLLWSAWSQFCCRAWSWHVLSPQWQQPAASHAKATWPAESAN